MAGKGLVAAAVHGAVKRVPLVLLILLLVVVLGAAAALFARYVQRNVRALSSTSPVRPAVAYADPAPRTGNFTTSLAYTSIDAPGNGEVSSSVSWDDGWFLGDETAYNHDLARTCSVLAALAYSESGYYQAMNEQPAYMEDALAALGFTDISTESYRYRSEIVDEVLNLVTDESDGVAYTVARKPIVDEEGNEGSLLLVSIRGSYGSEWLSNFNFFSESDHQGYLAAAEEVEAELATWIGRYRGRGESCSLLVVGHSRGGAVANLVASDADDARAGEGDADAQRLAELSSVRAYTFASPATTSSTTCHDARYDNIMNIVNPSDVMPYLPLSAWGYERYGRDFYLPREGGEGFGETWDAVRAAYRETFGVETGSDPGDAEAVRHLTEEVAERVSSAEGLVTPEGVVATVASCVNHLDPGRILCSHYPSTYIAWLQTIDADALSER